MRKPEQFCPRPGPTEEATRASKRRISVRLVACFFFFFFFVFFFFFFVLVVLFAPYRSDPRNRGMPPAPDSSLGNKAEAGVVSSVYAARSTAAAFCYQPPVGVSGGRNGRRRT
jgi:hypothetical protein